MSWVGVLVLIGNGVASGLLQRAIEEISVMFRFGWRQNEAGKDAKDGDGQQQQQQQQQRGGTTATTTHNKVVAIEIAANLPIPKSTCPER